MLAAVPTGTAARATEPLRWVLLTYVELAAPQSTSWQEHP
jgi:hypothetical protein